MVLSVLTIFVVVLPGTALAQAASSLQYAPVPYGLSGAVLDNSEFNVALDEPVPNGLRFNDDGTRMYVQGYLQDVVIQHGLAVPYSPASTIPAEKYVMPVPNMVAPDLPTRMSGIDFSSDGMKFYVLSQRSLAIFEYDLTSPFDLATAEYFQAVDLSAHFGVYGSGNMSFSGDGTKLYITDYQTTQGNIVEFDVNQAWDISSVEPSGSALATGGQGVYGLAFSGDGKVLYSTNFALDLVSEFRLDIPWDISSGWLTGAMHVLPLDTFMFGLAFNGDGTGFFLVGSEFDNIHEFKIEPASYPESAANGGGVDNSNPLMVTLDGDTFQDLDGDNLLDVGTEVLIENVPVGLTPVVALSAGDTVATLTFLGTAVVHKTSEASVAGLSFSFQDLAFTSGNAASVIGAGGTQPFEVNVPIDFVDNPAFTVSETRLVVEENSGTKNFTVVLDIQPSANVVLDVVSADSGEATVSPRSLTFTPHNWDTPQSVVVTGVDDSDIADHSASVEVSINSEQSDAGFVALDPQVVAVVLVDDDSPPVDGDTDVAPEREIGENAAPTDGSAPTDESAVEDETGADTATEAPGELAATGAEALTLVVAGVLLLLVGTAAIRASSARLPLRS